MKTLLITIFLLSSLMADQNNSSAFGTQNKDIEAFNTFKQQDGSSFKGISCGQSFFTYVQLPNDYIGVYNKESKMYEYALIKEQKLVPSGVAVSTNKIPSNIKKIDKKTLDQLQEHAFKKHL